MTEVAESDWLYRAVALCNVRRFEEAEEELREGLREEPEDPVAHVIHALVLLDLNRAEEALQAAARTIELAPDFWLGHLVRAVALLPSGRLEDAEAAAEEAIRLDPESGTTGRLRTVGLAAAEGDPDWEQAAPRTLLSVPATALAQRFAAEAQRLRENEAAEDVGPTPLAEQLKVERFSSAGPAAPLEDAKSSAYALVASAGAAVLAVVLALAVSPGFWIAALVAVFLALAGGSAYEMSSPPRRIVFGVAIAAGVVAFVAGALIAVGAETAAAVMAALALLSVVALLWVARVA